MPVLLHRENPVFMSDHLITYIGNKRALLDPISDAVAEVHTRIGRQMTTLDAFTGSGVVARLLKRYSDTVIVNDIEPYAAVLANCYLANRDEVPLRSLADTIREFNRIVDTSPSQNGFIERLYAPGNDDDIQPGERAFYTRDNARRIDHYAQLIHNADPELRPFLLGPLLVKASVHANTAGVFKGFYKDRNTGIGKFGGAEENALVRIKGQIRLTMPIFSEFDARSQSMTSEANTAVREVRDLDLAYFDPPYNQHPYGSNYFMLNLIAKYVEPQEISAVSGIPTDWTRSEYNVKRRSLDLMTDLVANTDAKFLLISFNDEGFIDPAEMLEMLRKTGKVSEQRTQYNAFRGSRNLQNRHTHVTEHLYLVEKS